MDVNKKIVLSIDLGGSSAKVALINNMGEIVYMFDRVKTSSHDQLENIWSKLNKQLSNFQYDAIGLTIPGMINKEKGIVLISGNLNWKNYDINIALKNLTNKPCFLINDANAAALGEFWKGAGKKYQSLLFYTIGTGIGGGIIINNNLITGFKGTAGEFGHGGNFQSKKSCNCGLMNCLEPLTNAIYLKKALENLTPPVFLRNVTNEMLIENNKVRKVFFQCWNLLTDHMAIMIYALNPEAIIVGGGISNIGNEISKILLELIQKKVDPLILKDFQIHISKLGNTAGIFGAAKTALDSLNNK